MGKPADIKTKQTTASVEDFLSKIDHEQRRKDSIVLVKLMEKIAKQKPKMWGATLIGFGSKRYKGKSGREVDWFLIGFSPRKANLSLYLFMDVKKDAAALEKLGKHKTGMGCVYINKLEDVEMKVLEKMIADAFKVNSTK